MVYLSRIYTKSGDSGETGLGDGTRVLKSSARVTAYGEVDELNAVLGLVAPAVAADDRELILHVQNNLFDLGADLCCPPVPAEGPGHALRSTAEQIERWEREIDRRNERRAALRRFLRPGGTVPAGWMHLARTVCRRAERSVVALMQTEPVNPNALIYLNRLSDLLFVMARVANDNGQADVLWVPGQAGTGG